MVSTENKKYKVTHYNDLCYNPANLKFGVICLNKYGDAIFSPIYITFEIDEEVDVDFLGANLTRWDFINRALRFQQGTVYERMAVSPEDFLSIQCYLPSKAEQICISSFVQSLNKRIDKQEKLVEALKKYKRGAFDAVFTQKIRLIPEHEQREWTVFNLSDFATRITRKNGNKTDIPLTISAQYGLIDQRKYFSKTVASSDMSGYFLLHQGEFAYNRSTSNDYPLGSIKRLEQHECGAVSTLYLCFAIKESVVLPELAKWYFETSLWHKGVREICAEGARSHGLLNVPTEGFFTTTHKLPFDLEEQRKIANYLGLIHRKCEEAEDVLMSLIRLRNGLVQRLFI